jgi:hypothetical protein
MTTLQRIVFGDKTKLGDASLEAGPKISLEDEKSSTGFADCGRTRWRVIPSEAGNLFSV